MGATGILIVEDEDDIRGALVELLTKEGYQVFEASNGQPALERLRTHPEGLVVLLDLMMPGMNGQAVLQTVAEEAPLAQRHAYILMTARGKTLPLKVMELLQHLRVTLVSRPFDLDVLLASIAKAASGLQE